MKLIKRINMAIGNITGNDHGDNHGRGLFINILFVYFLFYFFGKFWGFCVCVWIFHLLHVVVSAVHSTSVSFPCPMWTPPLQKGKKINTIPTFYIFLNPKTLKSCNHETKKKKNLNFIYLLIHFYFI